MPYASKEKMRQDNNERSRRIKATPTALLPRNSLVPIEALLETEKKYHDIDEYLKRMGYSIDDPCKVVDEILRCRI